MATAPFLMTISFSLEEVSGADLTSNGLVLAAVGHIAALEGILSLDEDVEGELEDLLVSM
jgi:hypothetical protein